MKHQSELARAVGLDERRDGWAKELFELNEHIEEKTSECKELEEQKKKQINDKQAEITAMKKSLNNLKRIGELQNNKLSVIGI
jgi:chromosome segregation ATPase